MIHGSDLRLRDRVCDLSIQAGDLSICVLYPSEHAMYINICICNIGERTVRCSRKLWCDHDF